MDAVSRIVERLYTGFVLRDILGFVVPGAVSLVALWLLCSSSGGSLTTNIEPLAAHLDGSNAGWKVPAFLAASYVLAWTLQAVHYAAVNLVAKCALVVQLLRILFPGYAPFALLAEYENGRVKNDKDGNVQLKDIPTVWSDSSVMTRVSLESDLALAQSLPPDLLEERVKEQPYTERLSALAIMSSNMAFAILLLGSAIANDSGWILLPVVVSLALYLEYWRLLRARNLQQAIYTLQLRRQHRLSSGTQTTRGGGTDSAPC